MEVPYWWRFLHCLPITTLIVLAPTLFMMSAESTSPHPDLEGPTLIIGLTIWFTLTVVAATRWKENGDYRGWVESRQRQQAEPKQPAPQPEPVKPPAPVSPQERAFRAALVDNPNDYDTQLVFADWLDEHGKEYEAKVRRDFVAAMQKDPRGLAWRNHAAAMNWQPDTEAS